jgi:protocatechuate 4,5-dioxygenase alpha chain
MLRARDDYVLDLAQARRGQALNRMLRSLMEAGNRRRFSLDEGAYCDAFELSAEHRQAVIGRDYTAMLELGASVFCAFKLTMVDNKTMQHLSAAFTGMSPEEFGAAMKAGGRSFG